MKENDYEEKVRGNNSDSFMFYPDSGICLR